MMWTDPIKFAAHLVRCPDDTPQDVQKLRCESAQMIRDQAAEIGRLRDNLETVKRIARNPRDGTRQTFNAIIRAAEAAKGK